MLKPRSVSFPPFSYIHTLTYIHQHTYIQDMESYRKHDLPMINSWLSEVEKFGGAECLIVYCITAAVRAKRHRTMTFTGTVDEKIMNEFKGRVDE